MAFPSTEQARVISHRGPPLVVVAGPGTGKTTAIVERMIRLLVEDRERHVSFVTFTRASRGDTQHKLEEAFGKDITKVADSLFPRTMTLHTFAKGVVHRYAGVIGWHNEFAVILGDEQQVVVEDALSDLGLAIDPEDAERGLKSHRCTGEWPDDVALPEGQRTDFVDYYDALQNLYRALDMETIVSHAIQIAERVGDDLPSVFLHVDEYQDLNPADQRLVQLAATLSRSQVVVVGDDAQSIYGFRFANYDGLRALWKSADWDRQAFTDCQRLPAHVLNAALDLIAPHDYLGANIQRRPADGRRIQVLQCTTSELQVAAMAKVIQRTIAAPTEPVGSQPGDFLVLCPTAAFVAQVVAALNEKFGIPAHTPSSDAISDELWQAMLVLRLLANRDSLALRQWLPHLGFDEGTIRELRRGALQSSVGFSEYCFAQRDKRLLDFDQSLVDLGAAATDVGTFRRAFATFTGYLLQEPLFTLIASHLPDDNAPLPPFDRLLMYVYQELGILEGGDVKVKENSVLVATMYAAKGLEAAHVLCPWLNARFMPMEGRDADEQRRLLYVAMTRAKRTLTLLFHEEFEPQSRRRLGFEALSPYLRPLRAHLDVQRLRVKDLS